MLPPPSTFQDAASLTESPQTDASLQLMEGRLTWLVHFIGAIIRGRLSSSSGEAQEALDGDLAARVFQLIKVTETGVHAKVSGLMPGSESPRRNKSKHGRIWYW